jgi:hypothetical protein
VSLEAWAVTISALTLTVTVGGGAWRASSRVAVRLAVLESKVDDLGSDVSELRGAAGLSPRAPRATSRGRRGVA